MDKQNFNISHSPLRQKPTSNKIHCYKDDKKFNRNDPILMAIEEQMNSKTSTHMFDLMLTDPLLQELNSSLQKQAEQQKKNKLLQTFPIRFKNLIHTQQLYKKLKNSLTQIQRQAQQTIESQSLQKQSLQSQLNNLKIQLSSKNDCIIKLKMEYEQQRTQMAYEYGKIIDQKSRTMMQIERKLTKSKKQNEYFMQQLQEIKEEAVLLREQNEKIIKIITQKQQQINNLNISIKQKQQSYNQSKQIFIKQLTLTKLNFQQAMASKTKQLKQANDIIEGYKIRMGECQDKLIQLCNEHEQEVNVKFNEIQEVRMKLLQQIKQKNNLEQRYQQLQQKSISEIQTLNNQIQILQQEISNLNIKINQNYLQHELTIHSYKQNIKKIQNNKYQCMQQVTSNISGLNQQKLLLQAKIIRMEEQKQILVSNLQKMKKELQVYSKKLVDNCSKQNKNEQKNKQIEKMFNLLKEQLKNYNQIINQKQQKIQQYRKQIFSLKTTIKDNLFLKQKQRKQLLQKDILLKQQKQQKQILKLNLLKMKQKQNIFNIQKGYYQNIINKQKNNKEIQFQIIQGFNDQEQVRIKNVNKELQKIKEKYDNIYEQLQEYKKEMALSKVEENHIEQINGFIVQNTVSPYQNMIKELQQENSCMKQLIKTKLYEPQQIQNLLDSKIVDLKTFYESRIKEEGKKYRGVIQMLKSEVTQLSKQMNLKKSMQQQMYNEIVQINEVRNGFKHKLLE